MGTCFRRLGLCFAMFSIGRIDSYSVVRELRYLRKCQHFLVLVVFPIAAATWLPLATDDNFAQLLVEN